MSLQINRTKTNEAVLDQRTGAIDTPSDYVSNLREIEVSIQRCDDRIGELKADLKSERELREKAVTALRSAVREGKVLPLLESPVDADGDDDADDEN
jgi:hypothetical protein